MKTAGILTFDKSLLRSSGGEKDHIAPPVPGKASLKKYNSSVVTEFKLFEGRGHSLIVDHRWKKDVADYSLGWLNKNGL